MPLLQSPNWPVLLEIYFFLAGVAGGAFLIAGIAELFGDATDRPVVKWGSYLGLLAIIPAPFLLTFDLGMPQRFLHMLWVSKPVTTIGDSAITFLNFHIKPYSPMNLGAWALLGFTLCAFITSATIYLEEKKQKRNLGGLRKLFGAIGIFFAFFIAAYPGQLLSASARPLWTDGRFLGALFLAIGGATGISAVALVISLQGGDAVRAVPKLRRAYTTALLLQALALVLFLIGVWGASPLTQQALNKIMSGSYSIVFWGGAVILGLVVPAVMELQEGFLQGYPARTQGRVVLASVLILIGGFLTKYVIFAAGQAV